MKLRRNDRDEVGMMILVILNTFPSFLSSQMFGKNVVFLDFIPIIPASFRHSGVIPKFHFNWNDAGMTNDFGLKLTTFPWLSSPDKTCTVLCQMTLPNVIAASPLAFEGPLLF